MPIDTTDPIGPFLEHQGALILDGGLATELEARGADLSGGLWSARLLIESPELVRDVHTAYLEAGADCITSASYQATVEGFASVGSSESEAEELLVSSVDIALEARETFWRVERKTDRVKPLVAASVGPYGAFLADGSEYTGDYDLDEDGLEEFHRRRFEVLASTDADLLAIETIPSLPEARALLALFDSDPGAKGWISFSCHDAETLSDGTPFATAMAAVVEHPRVLAAGVNCTQPGFISGLVRIAATSTEKPIVVYPNSGETYDATTGGWSPSGEPCDLAEEAASWRALGARLVGGCCRTTPGEIRRIRSRLIAG